MNIATPASARAHEAAFLFNPKHPTFRRDRYLHYKRLREEAPIHRNFMGIWVTGTYAHVRGILRDARFRSKDIPYQLEKKTEMLGRLDPSARVTDLSNLFSHSRLWMAFLEGEHHARVRRLVAKAFQIRALESLRPMIRETARELLSPLRERTEFELMREFSFTLPMTIIAATLGVPRKDLPLIGSWTEIFTRILDPLMSVEEYEPLDRVSVEAIRYFGALADQRRREPQADLLTALVQARDEADALTEMEIIGICIMLFAAGSETSGNLFGAGTYSLLRNPDQLALLRARPDLVPSAVEELLRFDSPLQMTSRTALEDVEWGGVTIRKGEQIYLILGSANRDPAQFEDPDRLNIERQDNPHVAFSAGPHFCVGAMLARIEAQEGFRAILDLFPTLELVNDEVEWLDHTVVRGPIALRLKNGSPQG